MRPHPALRRWPATSRSPADHPVSLTMLPALPLRLIARSIGPALPRQGSLVPFLIAETLGTTELARCPENSTNLSFSLHRSPLDSSAEAGAPATARSRAFVHVTFTSVLCLDDRRRKLSSDGKCHLRQRPRPLTNLASAKRASRAALVARCACDGCPASFSGFLAAANFTPVEPALVLGQRSRSSPVRSRGGPSNHERASVHEKRNVGQCLAARGVPHRHH